MKSWVFLFSQFTPEALLIESLLILLIYSGYTAFWILRKRKWGAIGETDELTGPVKNYLNHLIGETVNLRSQLFGLDVSTNHPTQGANLAYPQSTTVLESTAESEDNSTESSDILETQLAEQKQLIDQLLSEKALLEELIRQNKQIEPTDTPPQNSENLTELEKKIEGLEEKLNEYSIIEDDLADLKRFQQENTQLKALLKENNIPVPDSIPSQSQAVPMEKPIPEPVLSNAPGTPEPVLENPTPASPPEIPTDEKQLAAEFEDMFKV